MTDDGAWQRRIRPLYPPLIALWFPLSLYAANADEVVPGEILLPTAVAVGSVLALHLVLTLALRNGRKAALLVSILALLFFSYSALHEGAVLLSRHLGLDWLAGRSHAIRHRYLLPAVGLLGLLAAVPVLRTRRDLRTITRLANVVALVLVVVTGAQLALAQLEMGRFWIDKETGGAASPEIGGVEARERPDIYHLVLDRYANAESLKDYYAFDNEPFLGALERRGFAVARKARSNYARTILSISSTLDMAYHPNRIYKGHLVHDLREGHEVGRFLKERGYRYIHSGSWYGPTKSCDLADVTLQLESIRSDFTTAFLSTTALTAFGLTSKWEWDQQADIALYQFDQLERKPSEPGPRYVLAHFLVPHPPFVFDRAGKRARSNYLEQLQFVNDRLLRLVDRVLKESPRPVVFFLQADEGPYVPPGMADRTREEKLRLRTGVLYALRLPDGRSRELPSASTPINAFRIIFNECFGTELELLEDRVFSWRTIFAARETEIGPYEFEDVTELVLDR